MEKTLFKGIMEQIQLVESAAREKERSYFRNLVAISVGFLGIWISLNKTENMGEFKQFVFSMVTTLNALAILCALIYLYGEVRVSNRVVTKILADISKQLDDETSVSKRYEANDKPYDLSKTACLVFWVFALIALVIFSWL